MITYINLFTKQKDENSVDDDLALEFYDLDIQDDAEKSSKTKTTTTSTPRSALLK